MARIVSFNGGTIFVPNGFTINKREGEHTSIMMNEKDCRVYVQILTTMIKLGFLYDAKLIYAIDADDNKKFKLDIWS